MAAPRTAIGSGEHTAGFCPASLSDFQLDLPHLMCIGRRKLYCNLCLFRHEYRLSSGIRLAPDLFFHKTTDTP
jgi:hypothetical protein